MATSNKAKIARRVIEVIEFFDEDHQEATVMSIARRYDWPQSSTSELLSSLVDLGLLYKKCSSRTYALTPRAAMIGASVQPDMVRNGKLLSLLDRLVLASGHSVAVHGLVDLDAQIFSYRRGPAAPSDENSPFGSGKKTPLAVSAAGWLLLSTVNEKRLDAMLRRLNADAPDEQKFSVAEMHARINACRNNGYATGPFGHGVDDRMCAVFLPEMNADQPLVVSLVYGQSGGVIEDDLLTCLIENVQSAFAEDHAAKPDQIPHAASMNDKTPLAECGRPTDATIAPHTIRREINGAGSISFAR